MKYVLRTLFTTAVIGVLGLTVIALLRYLHPVWWKQRAVRIAAYALPIVTAVSGVLWMLGFRLRIEWLFTIGSSASVAVPPSPAVVVELLSGEVVLAPMGALTSSSGAEPSWPRADGATRSATRPTTRTCTATAEEDVDTLGIAG